MDEKDLPYSRARYCERELSSRPCPPEFEIVSIEYESDLKKSQSFALYHFPG
ncbi:hypothetical protein [Desulfobacter sp.]|uniref:hypothetical protein n=1 Tax=Desulfobacter sp. TaxID=2294 RepID=UPI003D109869